MKQEIREALEGMWQVKLYRWILVKLSTIKETLVVGGFINKESVKRGMDRR